MVSSYSETAQWFKKNILPRHAVTLISKYYARWKKPVIETIYYMKPCIWIYRMAQLWQQKSNKWLLGAGEISSELATKEQGNLLGDEIVL